MQLKIISWNIRHFRKSKVDDYIHTLWEVCNWAHVVFIYEDHSGLGKTFAAALNAYEAKHKIPQATWSGEEIRTTDEYVAIIWRSPLVVAHNTGAEAGFSDLMSGERCPAVVDVSLGQSKATIAAWHAYGPAKVAAKDLFQKILHTNFCDVLIGDFNFQTFDNSLQPGGLDVDDSEFAINQSMDFAVSPSLQMQSGGAVGKRSQRLAESQKMQEILPSNHNQSTTYTETGVGKRTTGLDRCVVLKQFVGAVKLCVAQPKEFDEMASLTDHMPLLLIFEIS